mgnify:CR=1 FL=1
MFNNQPPQQTQPLLTPEQIEVRVWAFVVAVVTVILAGIVAFMLYSLAFVVQPIKSMAPIDQAFTKMLNDIVLLIVGGIGGILTKGVTNEARAMMDTVKQGKDAYTPPPPPPPTISVTKTASVPLRLSNTEWQVDFTISVGERSTHGISIRSPRQNLVRRQRCPGSQVNPDSSSTTLRSGNLLNTPSQISDDSACWNAADCAA